MSTEIQYAATPERLPQKRLWFGTCAAAAAFAAQEFICFQIAIQSCKDGHLGTWGTLSPGGVRWVLGGISCLLFLVALAGAVISLRNWRAVSERRRLSEAEGYGREAFMALAGIFISVAFLVGIVWLGIPMLVLNTCVTVR